jgi:hypothetical protein
MTADTAIIISGNPNAEELAAVLTVLMARAAEGSETTAPTRGTATETALPGSVRAGPRDFRAPTSWRNGSVRPENPTAPPSTPPLRRIT